MISMRVVKTLVDAVAEAGVPRSRFLRTAKLDPACMEAEALDARVPRSKLYDLVELALEQTGDPAHGLHSIERLTTATDLYRVKFATRCDMVATGQRCRHARISS
jgi:hypothetical protein